MADKSSSNSGNERAKQKHKTHKNKNGTTRQHHPWDEGRTHSVNVTTGTSLTRFLVCMAPVMVSLPGATKNEQTILEEINQLQNSTIISDTSNIIVNSINSEQETEAQNDTIKTATTLNQEAEELATSNNLVNSHSQEQTSAATSKPSLDDDTQILDIESHLIETYDEYLTDDDAKSVGISELTPVQSELLQGTSKVETADNLCSIIEVEPVGVTTKQPIDTLLLHPTPLTQVKTENKVSNEHIPLLIKHTVNQLVDDIEREALEVVENTPSTYQNNQKTEHEDELKLELEQANKTDIDETDCAPVTHNKIGNGHIAELPSILKTTPNTITAEEEELAVIKPKPALKVIDGPKPQNAADEQDRQLFIESLPALGSEPNTQTENDAYKLSSACKREYYQSLKKYLIQSNPDKPPVPIQTYRWEDLRRAKERGGYPWTHLYKRPLGPDEEPEIVLLLRKSQELRFASESPKSLKKVRIDEQVLVQETDRYIEELSETEAEHTATEEELEAAEEEEESHSLHSESISCVSDSVLATRKPRKSKRLANIRALFRRRRFGQRRDTDDSTHELPTSKQSSSQPSRVHSEEAINSEHVETTEKEKKPHGEGIMKKLRNMADRQKKRLNIRRITLKKDEKIKLGDDTKILHLRNSPKCDRGEIPHFVEKQDSDEVLEIVELEESPSRKNLAEDMDTELPSSSHIQPDEIIEISEEPAAEKAVAVEVEVESSPPRKTPRLRREHVYEEIEGLEVEAVQALKESLAKQDNSLTSEIEITKSIPLDRMGSSEEEQIASATGGHLLAPISSIDSTSSEEVERIKAQLSPVEEEAVDADLTEEDVAAVLRVVEQNELQLKPSIKKEPSPAPSDKKVTFSHVEDEAEPHREDIELSDEVKAAAASIRTTKNNDHEYEPIGVQSVAAAAAAEVASETQTESMQQAEDLQKDFEERYFSSETTTPRTESRTDYEIHTSQIDSSALEELPLKSENRKKGFMATAQDRTRRMQVGFKTQAGKIKTKFRTPAKKPATATESPKVERRKRFKAPEFSKIKMPEIKRPDMSKFKDFKRPEFTKFNTPDMSKYKISDKFSIMKLRRSKSFKENETSFDNEAEPDVKVEQKKMFDFNFGTYPRAFRKKKAPVEPQLSFGTEEPSIIPSTETQPSMDSSSSPKGDRGPGPVRSRWADKFSDVSYNDSEGSRYRRYESELGSFDRDSLLERRMKDDLEDTGSEVGPDLGILSGEGDTRQFAEFDEENRAIHEISSQRAKEFKRRPMVHQDSDLRSEDSKDLGWTEKEIQKNKLLRKAELEAEASYLKYPSEERRDDTVSTASSGKKVVMEQIDDDEFFLRKRGVSEDNIEFRQYISNAIRQGYDMPINALQHVGNAVDDFEAAPPKPRRLHKPQRAEDVSQEFQSRSEYGDDLSISQNGSDFYPPKRPLRKGRSRSKYSVDSQDIPITADHFTSRDQYFDDDEEYLKPPLDQELNNLDKSTPTNYHDHPQPPRRRKRRESSMDKDSYVNGLTGRSVSSSYLQPNEDVIVYRTEHQYPVPLATPEHYTDASRSMSRFDDGEGTHEVYEKYVIDMMENDGYATVRKEQIPKPTPPARRKKFSRTPGERLKRSSTSPPERPPPPQQYSPSVDVSRPLPPRRKSAQSLETPQNFEDGDYEDPAGILRPESPRNLHSGDVINKMKYRPLPAPPRPPREKRLRGAPREPFDGDESYDDRDGGGERIASSSTADSYEQNDNLEEVEASTQTDPLPDDFICEEFEITPDMKIIEPRRPVKTLAELLREAEEQATNAGLDEQLTEDEQLAKGLQRFREANQRSVSERSRVSSHSLSRPQTPSSAIIIERRVSSPVPSTEKESIETAVAAALIVHPIQDLDLEEAELRREGLLTDSSQHSKMDEEEQAQEQEEYAKLQAMETELESEVESSVAKEDSEAEQKSRYSDYYEKDSADEHDIAMISKIDVQSELERIRREEQADIQRLQNEMDALLQTSTEQQTLIAEAAHKDEEQNIIVEEPAPQPPPRRRSSVNMELPAAQTATGALVEQPQFPTHIADLEVERLRVNALQAGQIMVGQFHGAQVSADELECKSGNLIVHHLELPPGFIEDIVGKVRSSERAQLLSSETQTSEHASRELLPTTETDMEMETFTQRSTIPPPKPPRQRELSLNTASANAADNLDEETQTEGATSSPNMVPVFPTIEYLQSLAPLAFYNLERQTATREHARSHHHYHRCESSGSDLEDIKDAESDTARRRRQRTCSSHASTSTQAAAAAADAQSLAQASRQFISACSMSLINTINKLTSSLDNEKGYGLEQGSEARPQQRAQMILLLAVLIFAFFLFMMSGRNVHTHHWDYFNPPGNEGRPS